MARVLLALALLAIVELTVVIAVAKATSVLFMFLALIVLCAGGAWLVKRQGLATMRRINEGFGRGEVPTDALLDGFIWVVAGALLLLPGFVSDFLAVLLILPPTRAMLRPVLVTKMQARATAKVASAGGATFTTFGFSNAGGGFRASQQGNPFADPSFGRRRGVDDDIIDLDAEEVYLDDPRGEIDPPKG